MTTFTKQRALLEALGLPPDTTGLEAAPSEHEPIWEVVALRANGERHWLHYFASKHRAEGAVLMLLQLRGIKQAMRSDLYSDTPTGDRR